MPERKSNGPDVVPLVLGCLMLGVNIAGLGLVVVKYLTLADSNKRPPTTAVKALPPAQPPSPQ